MAPDTALHTKTISHNSLTAHFLSFGQKTAHSINPDSPTVCGLSQPPQHGFLWEKEIAMSNSTLKISDYQIQALARCFLPLIQKFHESDEGKRVLKAYWAEKAKQTKPESEAS